MPETINNPQAEAYEQQVMEEAGGEVRAGQAYELNGVRFDGIDSEGNLIEAKGLHYADLFEKPFAQSVKNKIIKQMVNQVVARAGKKIVWHVAGKDAVPVFQELVTQANAKGIIQIVLTPFTAP